MCRVLWWSIAQVITVIRRPNIVLQPLCTSQASVGTGPEAAQFQRLKRNPAKQLIQLEVWIEKTRKSVIIFMI